MRVLLSTIGSRGDVQPLVALASQLRALGQEVRLCVPPDFRGGSKTWACPSRRLDPRCADRESQRSTPALRPSSGAR